MFDAKVVQLLLELGELGGKRLGVGAAQVGPVGGEAGGCFGLGGEGGEADGAI